MKTSTLAVIVILILIIGGGVWYFMPTAAPQPAAPVVSVTDTGPAPIPGPSGVQVSISTSTAATSSEVHLTATGFSPKSVTIKRGGTVTFINDTTGKMWVASGDHPSHTAYASTTLKEHCGDEVDVSFDECKAANTYSFTFQKPGNWNYHNHLTPTQFGTIVVE